MHLKAGVSIARLTDEMREAATAVEECYRALGLDCWITSGDEETTVHHGKPVAGGVRDPHYEGLALDFRVWNVPQPQRAGLVSRIMSVLGPDYVVLWENQGQSGEHVHIQRGHVLA